MRNRLLTISAAIVIGLVYLINAQEKAPAPLPDAAPTNAVAVREPAPPAEPVAPPAPAVVEPAPAPAAAEPAAVEKPATQEEKKTEPVPAPEVPAAPAVAAAAPAAPASTNATESDFVALPDPNEKPVPGAKIVTNGGDTMSITLDDVEMADVIRAFVKISSANIVASPTNLTGRVTVNLKDVEWKPALMSILDMNNLGLIEKTPGSGVFSIVPKVVGQAEPLIVDTMFLRYASVSNIEGVVKSMAPAPGSVNSFASRNALVIRATSAQMSEIKNMLKIVDTMRDQVFIEAKFMELTDEAIKDLGINWQMLQGYNMTASSLGMTYNEDRAWKQSKTDKISQWDSRRNSDSQFKGYNNAGVEQSDADLTATAGSSSGTHGAPGTMTYSGGGTPTRQLIDTIDKGKELSQDIANSFTKSISDVRTAVLSADDFSIMLSALKQMNGVSVVSNPKLIVANEEPAIIHIGRKQRPFIPTLTPGQQGIAPVTVYNPGEPVLTGIRLLVTPTINTESNITVKIEPELTRWVKDDVSPDGKQTYPIVDTKTIKTVFCLESGKTVAIGGLTATDDRDQTIKVPLLGDIPLIGKYLFSWTHQQRSQIETIIFVTVGLAKPENVQADDGLPEDTELAKRKMIEQKVKRQKHRQEMERLSSETDSKLNADSEKAKSRLMKMSK